ncbi:MAG: ribonuclease HII, partial [Maribacter sp.]
MKAKLLFLLAIFLILNCTKKKEQNTSLLKFIPNNASIILKINDFDSFTEEIQGNEIFSKLKSLAFINTISSRLKPLQYINESSEGLLTISQGQNNTFDFTYVSSDSIPFINLDSVQNKIEESLIYENYEVKKYQIGEDTFYTSTTEQIQLLSSSQTVLEDIVNNAYQTKANTTLEKLYDVSNATKLSHIWINLNESDELLKTILGVNSELKTSNYADWISLDINLEEESILLDGITIVRDSTKNFIGLFSRTKPLSNTTTQLVPANVDSYKSYTFNNYMSFAKNQMSYLNSESTLDSLLNTVEEIGMAQIGSQEVIFLKTFGTANINDYLKNVRTNSIEFQGGEIFELGKTDFLNNCLNPLITNFEAKYSSILEDTFVFSQDSETIEKVITQNKSGNTFDKTFLFKNAEALTTEQSTIFSLANNKGFQDNLKKIGLSELAKEIDEANFSDFLFGSQLIADTDFLHTSYFIKKNSNTTAEKGVIALFDVQFNADISSNPQFVTNHRTNKKEIVVQDIDNVLYLISTKGKVIWKKQLEGAIQGKIQQVDIYKNGKLQLAFTTDNQFLIIDRNGKEVAPFSKTFEGGNLNPLAVFDYEGKKDYRFIVTQNKKVFMYNNKGAIVNGFKYTNAEDIILNAPQHFRIGSKDYLVFQLANGTLKILNRVGNVRVKVSEKINFSENDIKLNKNKFTLTTSNGFLYQIDTSGDIQKTNLNLNRDHGMDATSKTLATMNDNILSIRDKKIALDLGVYSRPKIFYLNDKIYVSVTDIQSQK